MAYDERQAYGKEAEENRGRQPVPELLKLGEVRSQHSNTQDDQRQIYSHENPVGIPVTEQRKWNVNKRLIGEAIEGALSNGRIRQLIGRDLISTRGIERASIT